VLVHRAARLEPGANQLRADAAPLNRRLDRDRPESQRVPVSGRLDRDRREEDVPHDAAVELGKQGDKGARVRSPQRADQIGLGARRKRGCFDAVDAVLVARPLSADRDLQLRHHGAW
jgi:hypothetical protein